MWPQIIYLSLVLVSIGVLLAKHGEPKVGTYGQLPDWIAQFIVWGLLYWGGFFDPILK